MSAVAAQNMEVEQPVIMFIDDEQRVLKSMRAMFRKDYEVHLANSGAEALELLEQHDIDVVVSDQRMPEMTGVEVLTEIKQRSPKTVRILLTGYADLEAVEVADLALGARPLATPQAELDLDLFALGESVEILAAITGQLEHHVLRIIRVVRELDDELAFTESLRDLLGFERRVKPAADLHCHGA